MHYRYQHRPKPMWPRVIAGVTCISLVLAGGMLFLKPSPIAGEEITVKNVLAETVDKTIEIKTQNPPLINLQPVVDSWVRKQSGSYGIVVYDPANEATVAESQKDKLFFTASMYKLSVAYLALIDFQNGVQNPSEVILAGQTRKQCVYKMIHDSDSPCGEAMLKKMAAINVGKRNLSELGLNNAIFPGFRTTAADVTTILKRLHSNKDLTAENTQFLLNAMKTQIYRKGVPAGMPNAVVADKIGYDAPSVSAPDLWVDGGIIYLPNGRQYIYCIFGKGGVGSTKIRNFATTIYPVLAN